MQMETTTHGTELEIKIKGETVPGNDAKIVKADVAATHGHALVPRRGITIADRQRA